MAETTVDMEPATVSHRIPGRLRLRFPHLKGADNSLAYLQSLLSGIPGVREVEANAVSGSLLVLHHCEEDSLDGLLRDVAGVSIEPVLPATAALADDPSRGIFSELLGFREILGGGLLLMGVIQLMRGNIATPATTAFWYALTLLSQSSDEPLTPLAPEE